MKISKKVIILSFLFLGISFITNAQESKVTIEFKNAETIVTNRVNEEGFSSSSEIYFETTEGEITESIKEDMITFLSLLKLYK